MDQALSKCLWLVVLLVTPLFAGRVWAAPTTHVFALIVTNNKSVTLSQPDLQYADDDGARYYQLFRAIAAEPDVTLLTSFDRSSAAVYASLVPLARAATRAQVRLAAKSLGHAVLQARSRGEATLFYLVYAGHGNVEEGRGYVELEDGRMDGNFIEHEVLERIPADTKHLVLDSCNSFFVINPRKPGGRRWATPKDMAFGFSARHPEVGLFLSTNSDSEVFEWSAIESGVFSHEVRSGLSGAADANFDGIISYSELAGFIDTANASIARETLRPHLFYRGPRGDADAALFPTSAIVGRRIVLSQDRSRLWVKNATGGRVVDTHKEVGPMRLIIPVAADEELFVYEEHSNGLLHGAPTVIERRIAPGEDVVQLDSLAPQRPALAQRGERLFGSVFAKPFGPVAYAQYLQASTRAPDAVYGLAQADLSRMHNYLRVMADQDDSNRVVQGAGLMGLGAVAGSVAVGLALDKEDRARYPAEIGAVAGLGAGLVGSGLYLALSPTSGARALKTFEYELNRSQGNGPLAFVKTEQWLVKMAERERTLRHTAFWLFEAGGVALAGLATAAALHPPADADNPYVGPALLYTEAAYFMVMGWLMRSIETPTERMLKLYHEDPSLKLHFGPVATPTGLSLGLSGVF